jgi:hypothetical protein
MLIAQFLLITHVFYPCIVFLEDVILLKKEGDWNLPLKGEQDWSPIQLLADDLGFLLEGNHKIVIKG